MPELPLNLHYSDLGGSPVWPVRTRGGTVKDSIFYPSLSLSSIISPRLLLHPTRGHLFLLPLPPPHSLHGCLSFNHQKDRIRGGKDSPKAPPLIPLRVLRISFEFLSQKLFKSSISWSLYSVQRFEFPWVEHHLRTPRRHPYRSIVFCWTHCENQIFGVGRPAPVWPVPLTGLTGDDCPTLNLVFFVFSTHIYVGMLLDHQNSYLVIPPAEIGIRGHWLGSGWH
jgi:hypothetical protein